MDFESIVQQYVTPDCETMNILESVDTPNMAADLNPETQYDDRYIVNLIDEMVNSPPTQAVTDQFFTSSPTIEIKDFSTLNLADLSSESSWNTAATESGNFANLLPVTSPVSPSPSEVSTASYESSLFSEGSFTNAASPPEVFAERKRGRGRRPKSDSGVHSSAAASKQKKRKAYEIENPYDDKEMERKRLNAINAKRHRDMQKQAKETLQQQLQQVLLERDNLKKQVETLQQREQNLSQQMESFKKQAFSLMSVFGNGQ